MLIDVVSNVFYSMSNVIGSILNYIEMEGFGLVHINYHLWMRWIEIERTNKYDTESITCMLKMLQNGMNIFFSQESMHLFLHMHTSLLEQF